MSNASLCKSQKTKIDGFTIRYEDVDNELSNYSLCFYNKTVYCNCDNPSSSGFYKYLKDNFYAFKLTKLYCSFNTPEGQAYLLEFDGMITSKKMLKGDGDFRSPECVEILKKSDIVITCPPFHLFREFISLMFQYDKKFIVLGNLNAITYRDIFALIMQGKMWTGHTNIRKIVRPDGYIVDYGNICWYSNINAPNRKALQLREHYEEDKYPIYDKYEAIEVNRISKIPKDYDGVMGVPITFLKRYNPKQFTLLGLDRYIPDNPNFGRRLTIGDKETYARILIQKKN